MKVISELAKFGAAQLVLPHASTNCRISYLSVTSVLFDTFIAAAYSAVQGSPHLPRAHHVTRRARNYASTALGSRRRTGSDPWPGEILGNV